MAVIISIGVDALYGEPMSYHLQGGVAPSSTWFCFSSTWWKQQTFRCSICLKRLLLKRFHATLILMRGQCFSAKELGDFENVVRGGVSTNKIIPRNIRRTFKAKESPLENIAREWNCPDVTWLNTLYLSLSFTISVFLSFCLFVFLPEGSQVSKVTLCVQILKWQWLSDDQG